MCRREIPWGIRVPRGSLIGVNIRDREVAKRAATSSFASEKTGDLR